VRGRPRAPAPLRSEWIRLSGIRNATDVQAIHDAPAADGHIIVSAPIDGPFGRTFTFADPDGYQITPHDRA
jgi:hypothetical protein